MADEPARPIKRSQFHEETPNRAVTSFGLSPPGRPSGTNPSPTAAASFGGISRPASTGSKPTPLLNWPGPEPSPVRILIPQIKRTTITFVPRRATPVPYSRIDAAAPR